MEKLKKWIVPCGLALVATLGVSMVPVGAPPPQENGTLELTLLKEVFDPPRQAQVEVVGGHVRAVERPAGNDTLSLVILNGRGLVQSGAIAHGDTVYIDGFQTRGNGDKKHKHRGHVTILK